jgi:hypothetical protein
MKAFDYNGFICLDITVTKGKPEEIQTYIVYLESRYPNDDTPGKKKGDILGGFSTTTLLPVTLEEAKAIAREMWLNWVAKYQDTQIEVWILPQEFADRMSRKDAPFRKSNFEQFKRDRSVPF